MSTLLFMLAQPPMDSYIEGWVPLCFTVCVSQSSCLCSHTLFRMCTCISTWIYIPQLPMHGPTLGIISWKPGCPCMAVCLYPSHLISVATHFLECVHASVHEFMSIWLPMSGPPPSHSFKENWVPLYSSVFLSQASHFCSYTLFRMCTCIYVPLLPMLAQPPVDSCMETWSAPMLWCVCVCAWHPACVATPSLECVQSAVHEFMSTWLPMSLPSPMHSFMESCVPLCVTVCVPVTLLVVPCLV